MVIEAVLLSKYNTVSTLFIHKYAKHVYIIHPESS